MGRKNPVLVPTTLATTEIKIDSESVVAIKVAEFESNLLNQQAAIEGALRDLKVVQEKAHKAFESELDTIGTMAFDVTTAVNALKALGMNDIQSQVQAEWIKAEREVHVSLELRQRCEVLRVSKNVPINGRLAELYEEIERVEKEMVIKMGEMSDVRRRLSQISTIERQARASLAVNALNRTAEGRELLAEIKVQGLPSLPAPK